MRSRKGSRSYKRKFYSRGWKKLSPKKGSQRNALYRRCGSKSFLSPSNKKFPIVSKRSRSCKPNCKGLLAAYIRSRQYKYPHISRKARSIAKKMKCSWL